MNKLDTKATKFFNIVYFILIPLSMLLIFYILQLPRATAYNFTSDKLALTYSKVINEPYRTITYMFVHTDLNHLISNVISYFLIGSFLYKIVESRDFFVIYFMSGITGGMISAMINLQFTDVAGASTIGSSASIYGLLGAYIAVMLSRRGNIWYSLLITILFWFLLPILNTGQNIDWAAHFGGFIAGLTMGTSMADRRGVHYNKQTKIESIPKYSNIDIKNNRKIVDLQSWKKKKHWRMK